jgi:hypothetical protein
MRSFEVSPERPTGYAMMVVGGLIPPVVTAPDRPPVLAHYGDKPALLNLAPGDRPMPGRSRLRRLFDPFRAQTRVVLPAVRIGPSGVRSDRRQPDVTVADVTVPAGRRRRGCR